MIVQLILDSVATGLATVGVLVLRARLRKPTPNRWGSIPWTYKRSGAGTWGFYCSKCININKNTAQMPYCTCEEYHTGHFHFKCGDCGYTTIMRTADDKE